MANQHHKLPTAALLTTDANPSVPKPSANKVKPCNLGVIAKNGNIKNSIQIIPSFESILFMKNQRKLQDLFAKKLPPEPHQLIPHQIRSLPYIWVKYVNNKKSTYAAIMYFNMSLLGELEK